jgi:hypothetical protein
MQIRYSARAVILFICCLLVSIRLSAEEHRLGEIFAGYSMLHGDLQKNASGWELSAGKNFNNWLSLHADFDAHHQSSAASQRHQHDFLFGPQFSRRTNHFTLFAHTLAGVSHATGIPGTQTGFGSVAGGGVDWDYNPAIAFRFAQVDYHTTYLFSGFQNDARFSFGVVFHLIGFGDPARPAPPPDKKPSCRVQ